MRIVSLILAICLIAACPLSYGSSSGVGAGGSPDMSTATHTLQPAHGGTGATTLTGAVQAHGTSAMTAGTLPPGLGGTGLTSSGVDTSKALMSDGAGGYSMQTPAGGQPNVSNATGVLSVPHGGTGAVSHTAGSYLKGNGTSAVTGQAVPIPVSDGGTGAVSHTAGSYLKGNGTSAVSGQAVPIPVSDGGTGAVSHTAGSYLKGNGTSAISGQAVPIPVPDGGTGLTDAGNDNSKALMSDGAGGFEMRTPAGGGGGGGPFPQAGLYDTAIYSDTYKVCVAPAGNYAFVSGELASNSHGAISKVSLSTGQVSATLDLGAGVTPIGLVSSSDGAFIYAFDGSDSTTWWKIDTSDMSIEHTSTLAVGIATGYDGSPFDLSPNDTSYAYVSNADRKVYFIDTSTYAVTNVTVGHSGTTEFSHAVGWDVGSSTDFWVAYDQIGDIDKYASGTYDSSVTTTLGDAPGTRISTIRSGINDSTYLLNPGASGSVTKVTSGTPTVYPVAQAQFIEVNTHAPIMSDNALDGLDLCLVKAASREGIYILDNFGVGLRNLHINMISDITGNGISALAWFPDDSSRVVTWIYPRLIGVLPGTIDSIVHSSAGKIPTSDGSGGLQEAYPFTTTGWSGSDTVGGGGTVTVTCGPCTTSSHISLMNTTATVHAMNVTTRSNGSFVVTGTASDTFGWTLLKP